MPNPLREKLQDLFADAMMRLHGERFSAALVARFATEIGEPALTPLEQLIDDVQRLSDHVESAVDMSHDSLYWTSDLVNSVERVRRTLSAWREIVAMARQEERGGGSPTGG